MSLAGIFTSHPKRKCGCGELAVYCVPWFPFLLCDWTAGHQDGKHMSMFYTQCLEHTCLSRCSWRCDQYRSTYIRHLSGHSTSPLLVSHPQQYWQFGCYRYIALGPWTIPTLASHEITTYNSSTGSEPCVPMARHTP